ncbi:MAG: alpha-D-ribose 1-methylphosphonate 5-triphosphate diphosphatase [Marivibrio sp.]|uniref:alpha-D-ribose 1-methylphosphonate 5-triphosphate diphosphatase n=1 Tax=Marivibrio sp. TaxID=2039719 RepID=UPI0032EAE30C
MQTGDGLTLARETRAERVLTNARLILAEEVVQGTIALHGDRIHAVDFGRSALPGAEDCEGDLLAPGLVELHTDNLEKHMMPRPQAHWPAVPAVMAHDSQIAAAGITTVFDALAVGTVANDGVRLQRLEEMVSAIEEARREGLLKVDHLLHLRCEISFPDLAADFAGLVDKPGVRLISVMDHTPGQRQFTKLEVYRSYYMGKFGMSAEEMERFIDDRRADQQRYAARHRRLVVEAAHARGLALASHDDATPEHVAEAVADGMTLAEFPTTIESAAASHQAGLAVMMGAPNLVRGGSHSGNVSAMDLARRGTLDAISSDYAPAALLPAAMMLAEEVETISLPQAIAAVTKAPALAAGLTDRGEIREGLRADLIRIRDAKHPILRGVWRGGERVA